MDIIKWINFIHEYMIVTLTFYVAPLSNIQFMNTVKPGILVHDDTHRYISINESYDFYES